MSGRLFLIALLLLSAQLAAQSPAIEQAIEYLVEFGQTESSEPDLVQVAEQLAYLENNPIPINTATADELLEIPLLHSFLVFHFIEYRNQSGKILSYYQLADVQGFDKDLIRVIKPFTTLSTSKKSALFPKQFDHQIALQYNILAQQVRGVKDNIYRGDASVAYLRYRVQGGGKLFAGITAQKDAGEPWLTSYQPDFLSFHLEYRINKTVKNIVLGDFSGEFGQGLVLWSSLAFNKSSEAVNIERFGRGLRHYTGVNENRFLRGVGTTIAWKDLEITTYFSSNKSDANIIADSATGQLATSLQTSGFHRTENELQDKNTLNIKTGGLYLQWRPNRFRLGLLTNHTQFSLPIQFADKQENALRFSGNQLTHTSVDWKWLYGRMFLFGEAGIQWHNQVAAITGGIQIQAADGLQWVAQYRYISSQWFTPFAQPFSETGREGERGFYLGFKWQLPRNLNLAVFADHFQYLWLRSNLNRLGNGRDYMAQLNFTPNWFTTYIRFRYQERLRTLSSSEQIKPATFEERLTLRWHSTFFIHSKLSLQTRIEWSQSKHENIEQGILGFIGARYNLTEKWQIKLRYTVFDTQSFSSAIYAYEDDLPYNFSVPALFDNGQKWYVMVSYTINPRWELWVRIADASYPDVQSLGSGYGQIEGGRRTELKTMIRMRF